LFVTVSGAHLYGFPSPDSDIDLRGCHLAELREVVGLGPMRETLEQEGYVGGIEVELVSHDIGKYLRLLLRNNGYILEQVFSPIVVQGQVFLDELRPLAARCITRHHYHHYRGFYCTQRRLIERESPKRAKPLLYAYRVLMTGIHLLRTGQVEANLRNLNEDFRLEFLDDLVASKVAEHAAVADLDWEFHAARLDELERTLDQSFEESKLPVDRDRTAINELLIRSRLG
jgi:predicted nucleotidyltransferase